LRSLDGRNELRAVTTLTGCGSGGTAAVKRGYNAIAFVTQGHKASYAQQKEVFLPGGYYNSWI